MKRLLINITVGIILVASISALSCAPTKAPIPAASPLLTQHPQDQVGTPKSSSAFSPDEVAWQKVVEAARKEGKVNAYSFNWVGDVGLAISRAFKEKYGISIEIVTGRGAEFLERMKTEKRMRQQLADITDGNSVGVNNMKLEGLLASVYDELPVFKEKGVWWVEPTMIDPQDKANLIFRLVEYAPYVNTKVLKSEDVPRSRKDLLDPKWKGNMSLSEPKVTPSSIQVMVVLMDKKVWDEDYIRALYRQNLRFYTGLPDELLVLARGETKLQIVGSDTTSARFVMEGAPIQAIDMREGIVVSSGSQAAVAGGPNPNAARLFLNWFYSQEGMSTVGKALGNKMVRKDVADFRPKAVQAPITNPFMMTLEQVDRATELFRQRWFDKLVGR